MLLWRQVTNLAPATRASALILQMDVAAPRVCVAAESSVIMDEAGTYKILIISRESSATEAVDSVYRRVVCSLQFERTDQTMESLTYIAASRDPNCICLRAVYAERCPIAIAKIAGVGLCAGYPGIPFCGESDATTFWSVLWRRPPGRSGSSGYACVLGGRSRLCGMGRIP